MGRHTKLMEVIGVRSSADQPQESEQPEKSRGLRWVGRVPLLPMLALVIAVALVGYAWTTKQISLNFAGAVPPQANKCVSTPCASPSDQGRTTRASRGAARQGSVTVAFRVTGSTATAFRGAATLVNHGTKPVKGWTLVFRTPKAKMVGASGAVLLKSAATLATFRSTKVIVPGQTVRLVFTGHGRFSAPTSCRLTGALCRVA
jgi:hypothetical protein